MNTADEGSSVSRSLDALSSGHISAKDQQIAELEEQLTEERDARKEERFLSFLICVILFDVVFFSAMDNFIGPLAILLLQLIVLAVMARRLGIQEVASLMDRVAGRLASSITGKD